MRVFFALTVWFLILFFCSLFGGLFGPVGAAVGLAVGICIVGNIAQYFMISVPEVTLTYTVNLWRKNELRTYETGMHFRYPWEQVKEKANINSRMVKLEVTESYPSQNGPSLLIKWGIHYKPAAKGIPRFIAVDGADLDAKLTDIGGSYIGNRIFNQPDKESVGNRASIETGLWKHFEEFVIRDPDEGDRKIEDFYGVDIKNIPIYDIDWEERYQKVRTSEAIAKKIKKIADNLRDGTDIKAKDSHNEALIINGDITKHVQELEGDPIGSLLMAAANAIGGGKKDKDDGKKKGERK